MSELKIISLNDIESKEVEWLWKPYIPLGKLTIIEGDPGSGKTMLALQLASQLSNGVTLPFFSYGGSSLLVSMISIGIILCISKK